MVWYPYHCSLEERKFLTIHLLFSTISIHIYSNHSKLGLAPTNLSTQTTQVVVSTMDMLDAVLDSATPTAGQYHADNDAVEVISICSMHLHLATRTAGQLGCGPLFP